MADTSDGVPQLSASAQIAGEATQRVRLRARRDTLAKRVALGAAVATITAGVIMWATTELRGKADRQDLEALENRVQVLEPRAAAVDRDLDWIKTDTAWMKLVLWQIAQSGGLVVPPPPATPPPLPKGD